MKNSLAHKEQPTDLQFQYTSKKMNFISSLVLIFPDHGAKENISIQCDFPIMVF